jgi:hypothetical protein
MPTLKYIIEVIENLDGAGIVVEDLELVKEELIVMGFTDDEEEDDDEFDHNS